MRLAVKELKKRPISLNLILDIHSALMNSVRGYNKGRGKFRTTQNWIGAPGTPIEKATYVPPEPQHLMGYLDNFEKYIHFDEQDRLVQLAIIHAQFEIIHPFLDGNGRVGRILVPLFLYEKCLLNKSPMFYISAYFEANRPVYYEKLLGISGRNEWAEWIDFFLTAIIEQAEANQAKVQAILALYDRMKTEITGLTHSQFSMHTVDAIFGKPIFTIPDFSHKTGISMASAKRIVNALKNNNILIQVRPGKGKQAAILMFKELIDIVEK